MHDVQRKTKITFILRRFIILPNEPTNAQLYVLITMLPLPVSTLLYLAQGARN